MEYLLLILGLVSALLGIVGNAWDKAQPGLKKITPLGSAVITVLLFSFVLTTYSTCKKNREFKSVKTLVFNQIELGIWHILSPFYNVSSVKDRANFLKEINDTVYLSKLYKASLFRPFADKLLNRGHPYQIDSVRIKIGEGLLHSAIDDYHDILDSETIQYITNILTDDFYKNRYKLDNAKHEMILNVLATYNDTTVSYPDKSNLSYSTYGSFYSEGGQDKYKGVVSLIEKIETLYNHIKR